MTGLKKILIASAYLGPVEYFACITDANKVIIENYEHYVKQTYRNRCIIYTANGLQSLTIPVIKVNGNHTEIKDILIAYYEKWQLIHWRAIVSAYNHSPYFLYYKDMLEPFYFRKFRFLFEFNFQLLEEILGILDIDRQIMISDSFVLNPGSDITDLRSSFHPKIKSLKNFPSYIQVFGEKHGFMPNLSIIDLLFNEGPGAVDYLNKINS